jgi:RNA polymerase sigma factor (sigma-70 family)
MRREDPSPALGALPSCGDTGETERVLAALERIRPALRRLMARFRMPVGEAEDLAQNLALVALTRGHQVERLEAWLLGAAWNLCRTHCRRNLGRESVPLEAISEPACLPTQDELENRIDLEKALAALSKPHQLVVRLHLEDREPKEIASRSGYSENGLRKLLQRSIARMAGQLAKKTARRRGAGR